MVTGALKRAVPRIVKLPGTLVTRSVASMLWIRVTIWSPIPSITCEPRPPCVRVAHSSGSTAAIWISGHVSRSPSPVAKVPALPGAETNRSAVGSPNFCKRVPGSLSGHVAMETVVGKIRELAQDHTVRPVCIPVASPLQGQVHVRFGAGGSGLSWHRIVQSGHSAPGSCRKALLPWLHIP